MNIGSKAMIAFLVWFISTQFAQAARRLSNAELLPIINAVNGEFGHWFDPLDVLAIIQIESGGDPDAVRYESHLNDSSIGLMQVLYSTAQDRGFVGGPAGLFDPVLNIRMGMRQLKWSHDYLANRQAEAPSLDQWIGSYNAGVGNALKGKWVSGYVDKFRAARAALG